MVNLAENSAYLPTKAEERLLAAKLDPTNRLKTVVDLCKVAKIDPQTYYNAFRKQGFRQFYREAVIDVFRRDAAEVAHAMVKEAKHGNFQHGKLSLEMADIYTEELHVTTESYTDRLKRLRGDNKS